LAIGVESNIKNGVTAVTLRENTTHATKIAGLAHVCYGVTLTFYSVLSFVIPVAYTGKLFELFELPKV
jgi:hypothetical protein